MDEIIARIKGYVQIINEDLDDDDFLDFMVNDIVDRFLIFTNREQLVADYEEDLVDYPITDKSDTTETYYEFWKDYSYPIPPRLERVIARVINQAYKTATERQTADLGAIKSISDNGQSVSYSDKMQHFFNSSDDSEIFSGSYELFSSYRIPTIIKDNRANTDEFYENY